MINRGIILQKKTTTALYSKYVFEYNAVVNKNVISYDKSVIVKLRQNGIINYDKNTVPIL